MADRILLESGAPDGYQLEDGTCVILMQVPADDAPDVFVRVGSTGAITAPLFTPNVGRFRQGMIVEVPLQLWALPGTPGIDAIRDTLAARYEGCRFVSVATAEETAAHTGLLDPEDLNDTNNLRLYVFGNAETGQAVLAAQLDNLGKGASGAAVQNMNIMLGLDEAAGLL